MDTQTPDSSPPQLFINLTNINYQSFNPTLTSQNIFESYSIENILTIVNNQQNISNEDKSKLQEQIKELRRKSVTLCENCSIEFDLLANHYSIGLFDNIVYVKCPRCNKAIPVDSKDGVKKA